MKTDDSDHLIIDGDKYGSRLFHCFGHENASPDAKTAANMIVQSGTKFITFNTHNLDDINRKGELTLGFSGVTLDDISEFIDISDYVLLNNINHATSASEAVDRSRKSSSISGSKYVKMEVLNEDMATSNDDDVVAAAKELVQEGYKVMALCSCKWEIVKKLEEVGCILIRIMGSPIGSHEGIRDTKEASMIFKNSTVPVIVDGGIGTPMDTTKAMLLGADGVLVNASLFSSGHPVKAVKAMRDALLAGRQWYLLNS